MGHRRHFLQKTGKKFGALKYFPYLCTRKTFMVPVVQLVRASDCGSECRGFESHRAPLRSADNHNDYSTFSLAIKHYLTLQSQK